MTGHVSAETQARYERRELPPAELMEVLRHFGTCAECANRASTSADAEAQVDEVRSALAEEQPRRWLRVMTIAAAIAITFVLLAIVFTNRQRPVPTPTPPRVTTTPVEPAYANEEWTRLVRDAVRSGRLPFPADLAELRTRTEILRGTEADPTRTVQPTGVVVNETRPRFSWPARAEAPYVVSIFAGDREVARSEELRINHWRPSNDLARGRTYVWQVNAGGEIIPRPPAPPAMFRIVSEAGHRELTQAMQQHPGDPILHAVLLARSGLRDEALAALRSASAAGDARAARLLSESNRLR